MLSFYLGWKSSPSMNLLAGWSQQDWECLVQIIWKGKEEQEEGRRHSTPGTFSTGPKQAWGGGTGVSFYK